MGTSLVLKQSQVTIKISSTRSMLKVDTDTTPWRIFVSNDTKTRKKCYRSQLPQAMLELLGISATGATLAVCNLIDTSPKDEMEASILEEFDVKELDWVTKPPALARTEISTPRCEPTDSFNVLKSPFGGLQSQNTADTRATGARSSFSFGSPLSPRSSGLSEPGNISGTPVTSSPFGTSTTARTSPFVQSLGSADSTLFGRSPASSSGSLFQFSNSKPTGTHGRNLSTTSIPSFSFGSTISEFGSPERPRAGFGESGFPSRRSASAAPTPVFSFGSPTPPPSISVPRLDPPLQQQKYRALLDNIIKRVSGDNHIWNFNDLASALPGTVQIPMIFDKDETFGVRNEDHFTHDMKIGAAGELFVSLTDLKLRVD